MPIKKQNLTLGNVFKGSVKEAFLYKGSAFVYGVKNYKTLTFTDNVSVTFPTLTFSYIVHVVGSGGSFGGTNGYARKIYCVSGGVAGGYSKSSSRWVTTKGIRT